MNMERRLFYSILLVSLASAKDEDLPLCPTNFQFFPQSLPMHCRMPTAADYQHGFPSIPGLPTPQPPDNPQKAPQLPPIPGMPGPLMPMPHMPGGIPLPSPLMSIPGAAPNHKVPVIVMPFYSPDSSYKFKSKKAVGHPHKKHRRPHKSVESSDYTDTSSDTDISSDTDDTDDTDSSLEGRGYWDGKKRGWRRNAGQENKGHQQHQHHSHHHHAKRRHNKKKSSDLLTPVLQYVSKDGYVIYEKAISKGEAKDWLRVKDDPKPENPIQFKNTAEIERKRVETKSGEQDDVDERNAKEEERARRKTTPPHPRRFHREETDAIINKLQP